MKTRHVSQLPDHLVERELKAFAAHDRRTTAGLLVRLAEFDARRLYLPAGYPSCFAYCVGELGMSDDTAYKRIAVARAARTFPAIFAMLADGRLNLTAVARLSPHLAPESAAELLAGAAHKTKAEIERLLAERFPRPDVPTSLLPVAPTISGNELVPEPVGMTGPEHAPEAPAAGDLELVPEPVEAASPRPRMERLSPHRFALQVTIDQETHDLLRQAQDLLGFAASKKGVAGILREALQEYVGKLAKRRCAATKHPRPQRGEGKGRRIPAAVVRAVRERDGDQCTFVSEDGHRCETTSGVEFDHIVPFALGGGQTVGNIRLRCRPHSRHGADCAYGKNFMDAKRGKRRAHAKHEAARRAASQERKRKVAAEAATIEALTPSPEVLQARQAAREIVMQGLRRLGFGATEVRYGAALCNAVPDAPPEEQLRYALSHLAPGGRKSPAPVANNPT